MQVGVPVLLRYLIPAVAVRPVPCRRLRNHLGWIGVIALPAADLRWLRVGGVLRRVVRFPLVRMLQLRAAVGFGFTRSAIVEQTVGALLARWEVLNGRRKEPAALRTPLTIGHCQHLLGC